MALQNDLRALVGIESAKYDLRRMILFDKTF